MANCRWRFSFDELRDHLLGMKEYEVLLPRLASQVDHIVAVSSSLTFNRGRLFQTYQIAATILAHRRSEAAKQGTNAAVRYPLARVSNESNKRMLGPLTRASEARSFSEITALAKRFDPPQIVSAGSINCVSSQTTLHQAIEANRLTQRQLPNPTVQPQNVATQP